MAETEKKNEDTEEVFQSKRLWHFTAMPAWWFAWLAAHEGSHALMSQYWDWDIVSFKPYPHTAIIEEGGDAQFFWGATYLRCSKKTGVHFNGRRYVDGEYWPPCKDGGGIAALSLAPYVLNASIFAVSDLVLTHHLDMDTTTGAVVFMGGMVGPWVNSLFGSNFLTGGPDLAAFSGRTGTPTWATTLTFDAIMAVGAWRLYVHGKDMLFDTPRKKEQKNWTLLPVHGESTGLMLSLQF